jgi:uncharacterized membrane protein YfcA
MDQLLVFVAVGFMAQMIDGALGMAYGVSSTTFLLSLGVPPAVASAGVHTAEVFTTLVSGVSHLRFGNVDTRLLKRLVIPGIIGGVIGAYVLTSVPGKAIKPFVATYLLVMGIRIFWKAFNGVRREKHYKRLFPLGLAGGFLDAVGGGGWGPVVTSTLMANGHNPRFAIGSVNLSEFFVTLAEAIAFVALIGLVDWHILVGLMVGGMLAAPLAAYACKRVPTKALMIVVGIVVTVLSVRTIWLAVL